MAALLVAMTGCQKEPQVTENDSVNADVKGYVALKLQLPSTDATKADTPFIDGDAGEYKVNDLTLVFYDGAGNHVWTRVVTDAERTAWGLDGNTANNITSSSKTTALEVSKSGVEKVLVLINSPYSAATDIDGKSFDVFNSARSETAETLAATDDFFMSNAPYFNGSDELVYLVPVQVKATEAQALAAASTVKVERAVAKVTVSYDASYTSTLGKATVQNWCLDITNKSYFPVRKVKDYGQTDWWKGDADGVNPGMEGSRIYYAVDPNYETTFTSFDNTAFTQNVTFNKDTDQSVYCLENTFNTTCMTQTQTTRVMLKALYEPAGKTFSTANQDWFHVGVAKEIKTIDELHTLAVTAGYTGSIDDLANLLTAGDCGSTIVTGTTTVSALFGGVAVSCFKDGECYYPVRIRHFNDTEIDYNASSEGAYADFTASFTDGGYKKWDLGRYGVLRNTWYKINVTDINNPGTSTPETPEDVADDELKQYVACDIEILSWSVREHEVEL